MASQNLKQRSTRDDEPNITTTMDDDNSRNNKSTTTMDNNHNRNNKSRRDRRMSIAKRGLRSLAIGVSLPVSLALLSIYLGSSHSYRTLSKPLWFPPLWALHITYLASSFLMGLSAWLVWAEGGFHRKPTALSLYLAQLGLSLAWEMIVLGAGAPRVGLMVCLGMFGSLVGCSRIFKEVNSIAGDLVKPCLAWTAFLAVVNLKLILL